MSHQTCYTFLFYRPIYRVSAPLSAKAANVTVANDPNHGGTREHPQSETQPNVHKP
jgi:hypothetical protein